MLNNRFLFILLIIISLFFLNSCALFKYMSGGIEKPTVEFINAKLDKLTFEAADLLFDLNIKNPNSVGLSLAGLDYEFFVNKGSLLKGNKKQKLEIPSKGEKTTQLPLTINFKNLYNTFKELTSKDKSTYNLKCGLSFDIPVLGPTRIPISKKGELPLIKIPDIALQSIQIKNLNISSADMELLVKIKNPNTFSLLLQKLKYNLEVNGKKWIATEARNESKVSDKGEQLLRIPLSLNFLEIGSTIFKILEGEKSIDYKFFGNLNLKGSVPLLDTPLDLPFDLSGKVPLIQ